MEFQSTEETLSSSFMNKRLLNILQTIEENFTHSQRVFTKLFFNDNFSSSNSNLRAKRITTISRTMLTRIDLFHDFVISKNGRDRVETTSQSLG